MIIGIDPGIHGGMAALDSEGCLRWLCEMPTVRLTASRREYNLGQIISRLPVASATIKLVVELLQPLPASMGGGAANYARGRARAWEWLAAGMCIPCLMVRPQEWQREMLAGTPTGDTKARAIIAAQRLYPSAPLVPHGCRKAHDGLADALLIATWGWRRASGTQA